MCNFYVIPNTIYVVLNSRGVIKHITVILTKYGLYLNLEHLNIHDAFPGKQYCDLIC